MHYFTKNMILECIILHKNKTPSLTVFEALDYLRYQ